MWIWVLEVYFRYPESKYYWPEFSKNVFKNDKGKKLKRRMIIKNYKNLTYSEVNELADICSVHAKVI